MPTLEIITIGTELLLGEITDTNSTFLARTLRDYGIDIYRITTIGDNPGRITTTIREALNRADIIITTGGLGPTVDDPTRQAVAEAANRNLVFNPDLWEQILQRFQAYGHQPTENNRRQAYIPEGAIPISNPVGTAPCYIVEMGDACVISLPGVPSEMKFILHQSIIPFLKQKYVLRSKIIKATVLHAASMGESVIDEIIADLEELANPTVGLLAHPGQVDIRVTAKADSELEAQKISQPVVSELKARLGENIYGQDEETLESKICQMLSQKMLQLTLVEYGLNGAFTSLQTLYQHDAVQMLILDEEAFDYDTFSKHIQSLRQEQQCDIGYGAALVMDKQVSANFILHDSKHTEVLISSYGGPRENAPIWALNIGLDFLRRQLIKITGFKEKENHETG